MVFDLSSKVVLVAGGAGYLGQASYRLLAELGAAVIVADLSRQKTEALAAVILAGGDGRGREYSDGR